MDGRLDLVIGAFHHALPALDYRPLFDEEQTLYCGAGHALFRRSDASISLEDVSAAPMPAAAIPRRSSRCS